VADEATASPVTAAPRERAVVWSFALVIAALAWGYLVHLERAMAGAMAHEAMMTGMGMAMPWSLADFAFIFSMWAVMMIAMMAPAAAPVLLLIAGARARRSARSRLSLPGFALGYAIVWLGFSLAAALAQWILHDAALLSPQMAAASPRLSGGLLVAAGVYQLLPIKGACLVRCRSPLAFLMTHWRDGPIGALHMGMRHGTWCLGCCWALMIILFVVGVMNLVAVAALALFVLAEKTGPAGVLLARIGGIGLIAAGLAVFILTA
jgi:predicted metal-binding membrane protein